MSQDDAKKDKRDENILTKQHQIKLKTLQIEIKILVKKAINKTNRIVLIINLMFNLKNKLMIILI